MDSTIQCLNNQDLIFRNNAFFFSVLVMPRISKRVQMGIKPKKKSEN